jgi:hypothetical protein
MPSNTTGDARPTRNAGKAVAVASVVKAANGRKSASAVDTVKANGFDAQLFLTSVGSGRSTVNHKPKAIVFRQGDPADAVFYIQKGRIQITVVSEHGKLGIVAILGPGDFSVRDASPANLSTWHRPARRRHGPWSGSRRGR